MSLISGVLEDPRGVPPMLALVLSSTPGCLSRNSMVSLEPLRAAQ